VKLVKNYQGADLDDLIELFGERVITLKDLVERYGEKHDSIRLMNQTLELNDTLLTAMKDIKERIIHGRKNR
jgi:hypothetical protein